MYRGTTPTHVFEVQLDTSLIDEVKITYSQNGREIVVKRTPDCSIEPGRISVRLTQDETFKFDCKSNVSIQVRVLTTGGDALITDPINLDVGKCLDNEVLS